MVFAVPTRLTRVLYNTAKRVRDELGKGQETLREAHVSFPVVQNDIVRKTILIPDVDIIVVEIKVSGDNFDNGDTLDIIALANGEDNATAPGATNRLITQIALAAEIEDGLFSPTLLGTATGMEAPNRVQAGQPIRVIVDEDNSADIEDIYVQVCYILADEERTY